MVTNAGQVAVLGAQAVGDPRRRCSGRTKLSLPVCSFSSAPPWAGLVPCSEWMKQRSSTQLGDVREQLADPDAALAVLLELPRRARAGCRSWRTGRAASAKGSGLPSSRSSSGLGSNVSTCDGPPFMNRKMTRLARGGKCGGCGASGSRPAPAADDSSASSEARASDAEARGAARASIRRREVGRGR